MIQIELHGRPAVTHVDVRLDEQDQVVHVLDLDLGGMSLTNAIDCDFQKAVADYFGRADILVWRWWLYGTDGIISEFENGAFRFIDRKQAHPDFRAITEERFRQWWR